MKALLLLFFYLPIILSFSSCRKEKKIKTGKPTNNKVYKTLTVPTQYATIQAAINAAGENDTIKVLAGRYKERVVINKSVNIIGAGADKTQIAISGDLAAPAFEEVILVQSDTKINVSISNIEILGGNWNEMGYYDGSTPYGINVKGSKIFLKDIVVNSIRNFFLFAKDSELDVNGITLFSRNILAQADIGIMIINSKAKINHLNNVEPQIDHVIDINHPLFKSTENDFSDVTITNCMINTSLLNWGDGIRLGYNARLTVDHCNISRNGGEPMGEVPNTGIQLNNPKNIVSITNTRIDGLPIGINVEQFEPSSIKIEQCTIKNCQTGSRIMIYDRGTVDFGGGELSLGKNVFQNNNNYDVYLDRTYLNISAASSQWSTPANPSNKIWDKTDDPSLGRVIY